jgi:putative ABC transport system ATP-binding protein
MAPLIEMKAAGRHYEIGSGTVKALDGVDLEIEPGEFVVILGPSGSGKTTLLNLIGALDAPSTGTVRVGGLEVGGASRSELFALRRSQIGFIFQSFNLFPGLSALENVRFGADVAGREDAGERSERLLGDVGLGDRVHHFPHELSGGEQQRVAIARALAAGNPVLLADEPTGELVVTHNREIARMADRIVELSSGRIVSDAPNEPADMAELHW